MIGRRAGTRGCAAVAGFVALWLGPAAPVAGQETLTLEEALAIAARHSPALQQARNLERTAAAERLGSWGALLPSATATSGFSVTRTRSFTATGDFGDPAERESAIEATTKGANQGVGLGLTLFDGAERVFAVEAAGHRLEAAGEAARARWVDVRAEVALRYVALLESRALVEVEEAILAARRRDVETTEALFGVVAADQIDVLGARIEAARQEAGVAGAVERARSDEVELARAMGVEGRIEAALVAPVEPFDPEGLEVEALRWTALETHPGVRRLAAEADAAEAVARSRGWLAYLPRVEADASFTRSEFGGRGTPFFNLDPLDETWRFALSLSVPVFDGFARRVEQVRADVARHNADEAVRERRLEVGAAAEARWRDLVAAHRQLEIEVETARMSRERVALARQQHRVGAIDFTRLQQVIDQATASERALVARRFAYHRALIELERAVGRPVVPPGT